MVHLRLPTRSSMASLALSTSGTPSATAASVGLNPKSPPSARLLWPFRASRPCHSRTRVALSVGMQPTLVLNQLNPFLGFIPVAVHGGFRHLMVHLRLPTRSSMASLALSTSGTPSATAASVGLNPKSPPSARLLWPFRASRPCHSRTRVALSVGMQRRLHCFAARSGADDIDEARGKSTLPERFRYLTKETPDSPVRWPWLIALFLLVYAWRTVLWELTNWKKTALATIKFLGYTWKLALALVFHYIGDAVTGIIGCIEYCLYSVRYMYANIVAFAPVPELTRIIFFTTTVLAIATVPNAVNSQPYLLTLAGLIGLGAVKGLIPELLFWLLLAGFFCYSRFLKKRDIVSSALPSVAVLTAVGEPWVRCIFMGLYLAVAIIQYSSSLKENVQGEESLGVRRLPVPLLLLALSIGIHIAAKWVRYRHLTWMIS